MTGAGLGAPYLNHLIYIRLFTH